MYLVASRELENRIFIKRGYYKLSVKIKGRQNQEIIIIIKQTLKQEVAQLVYTIMLHKVVREGRDVKNKIL